ncbi:hypothetical protein [Janthinobacterium sp. B9-8]|uniref:hypothetical protein n=1 Tax=Janthinobacterium sp. B9-8 TaxID=1236179 RepID=UPI00061D3464|nr:hypothetical protein [Janthinobacterium sp. B9-8]AMC36490.1 hypothetical protein VN23_18810 [Janthinobacterium sp. B9-8]
MDLVDLKIIISRLDGYIDALSSIYKDAHSDRACAFSTDLDIENIDASINQLFYDNGKIFKENFPDFDVPVCFLERSEIITDWVRVLHHELEIFLFPKLFQELIIEIDLIREIKHNLAWQVMEMVRLITDDFGSEKIYKANYHNSESRNGVLFVIPLKKTCLVLRF